VPRSIVRVLVAASQPLIFKRRLLSLLDIGEERRRISVAVRKANIAAQLHFLPLVTEKTLATACQSSWDIIHLSGHVEEGSFLLEDGLGGARPITGMDLASTLTEASPSIIFLSSCYSETLAQAILTNSHSAIVAIDAIHLMADRAAILFGERFYAEVLKGCNAGEAFESARRAVADDPVVGDLKSPVDISGHPQPPWSGRFKLLGDDNVTVRATSGLCEESPQLNIPVTALPPPSPWFVGRQRETAHTIEALNRDRRCVGIVGPAGIGKTDLASAVICWFVERDELDLIVWASARP
jgi:hypothetical protein